MFKRLPTTIILMAFLTFLNAQTIPTEVQQKLNVTTSHFSVLNKVQERNNLPECLTDSSFYFTDYNGQDSTLVSMYVVVSDLMNNTAVEKFSRKDNVTGLFTLNSQSNLEYNNQNYLTFIEYVSYDPSNSMVIYGFRNYFHYYGTSNLSDSIVTEAWLPTLNSWANSSKTISTINSDEKISETRYFRWDTSSTLDTWELTSRDKFTYNSNGTKSEVERQFWVDSTQLWESNYVVTFNYDANNNLLEALTFLSNDLTTVVNKFIVTIDEVAHSKLEEFYFFGQNFNTGNIEWQKSNSDFFIYDDLNRVIRYEYKYYSNGEFYFGTSRDQFYIGNSNCLSHNTFNTMDPGFPWRLSGKWYYTFPDPLSTKVVDNDSNWSIAPNPSNGDVSFSTAIGANLRISNTSGQIIAQKTANEAITHLNLESQPAGLYFVTLQTGKGISTKMLQLVK
jgi:Secretion system C-terminal sorting domain